MEIPLLFFGTLHAYIIIIISRDLFNILFIPMDCFFFTIFNNVLACIKIEDSRARMLLTWAYKRNKYNILLLLLFFVCAVLFSHPAMTLQAH